MSAPVFRDPVHDGATDPTVIRRRDTGDWVMFYTQRRVTSEEPGVAWVHGTRIGVAVSTDAGASWSYRGTLDGLDAGGNTHWAPEVIDDGLRYRMYLTVIAGVHEQWAGVPRHIVEFQSDDLETWRRIGELELSSDRVIDAAVERCRDGRYRLWYKDEAHQSTTWAAVSDDLGEWTVEGQALGGRAHEGPNVFVLGDWYWMIVDEWRGQGVYRSVDGVGWERQLFDDGLILHRPGVHPSDRQLGRHADVVVQPARDGSPEHAIAFYFTHPDWDATVLPHSTAIETRHSAIHIARLTVVGGTLRCDRDIPPSIRLVEH